MNLLDNTTKKIQSLENFTNDDKVKILLESISEGILISDYESNIVYVNIRTCEIFGYEKAELENSRLDKIIPELFSEEHKSHVKHYLQKPVPRPMGQNIELFGRRKGGSIIPLEISLSFLETTSVKFGLAFITDITERKKAQDELRAQNEELDAFAHSVAHDLNSSINNIIGSGNLMLGDYNLTC